MIGQAKGSIREREQCDADQAFERLKTISQHRNVKLREVAEETVRSPDRALSSDATEG